MNESIGRRKKIVIKTGVNLNSLLNNQRFSMEHAFETDKKFESEA